MDFGIGNKLAVENQLISEEKWLIDALKKIQTQRHSLQIERLHLQSLKSRLVIGNKPAESVREQETFESLAVPILEEVPTTNVSQPLPLTTQELDDLFTSMDDQANHEELNLSVSQHVFQPASTDLDIEEDEDEEEEDCEDYNIDMNMFMNGDDGHNSKK